MQDACRSSRPEYDERVCLTSGSDRVLISVEYRLRVKRDQSQGYPVFKSQQYLNDYAAGNHPAYSTDIDYLLTRLYENP